MPDVDNERSTNGTTERRPNESLFPNAVRLTAVSPPYVPSYPYPIFEMSFLGLGGRRQPSSEEKIAAAEQELEMVTDMFNRITNSCQQKCIPTDYREGDLNKGESVCLDRCIAKFFDVNIKVGLELWLGGES